MESAYKSSFLHLYLVRYFLYFLQKFQNSRMYIEVLDPFRAFFVHSNIYWSNLCLLCVDIHSCQHHLVKMLSFLQYIFFSHYFQIWDDCHYMYSYLDLQFYLIDLHVFFSGTMYWILIYSLYNNLNYCVVIFLALFLAIQYHHKTFRIFYYICEELRVCYTFSFLRMVLMIPGEFIHFVKGIILLFDSIHRATLGSKYCSGWKDKTTEMPGFGWLIQIGETQFNKSASHHCFSIVL